MFSACDGSVPLSRRVETSQAVGFARDEPLQLGLSYRYQLSSVQDEERFHNVNDAVKIYVLSLCYYKVKDET